MITKDNSVTIPVSSQMDRKIKKRLDYGDYKSEWIREAIRMRLDDYEEISESAAGPHELINRKDISASMSDELHRRLVAQLEYGEGGKAQWVREAIRMRFEIDDPNPEIGKTIPERNNADTTAD